MRRIWAFLLLGLGMGALGEEGPRPLAPEPRATVLRRCAEVLRTLEVQALYQEGGRFLLVLGRGEPLLLLSLEEGRPMPHMGPIQGKPMRMRPFAFLRELSLARWVVVLPGEYRCFVLYRGRVVGVLRLSLDLSPLPLPPREIP